MTRRKNTAHNAKPASTIRCAVYTRKSTDENLDKDFNSLDAQREAGEAYIRSQTGEGWVCLPDRFDDGGYTGGNLDRPALKRLIADIEAEFAERDAVMAALAGYPRIELWFEHDLYDQLQLIQILACLAADARTEGVTLVQADDFLGRQRPDTILAFEALARPLDRADLDLGAGVWSALGSPTP